MNSGVAVRTGRRERVGFGLEGSTAVLADERVGHAAAVDATDPDRPVTGRFLPGCPAGEGSDHRGLQVGPAVDPTMSDEHRRTVEVVGTAGVLAMLVAHLVWDPALTLLGVARFGVGEEDADLVRTLLRVHPAAWLGAKVVAVGGLAGVIVRLDVHRDPATAWLPWVVALLGFVGPLGWIELLLL
jgi:hypothetical protein